MNDVAILFVSRRGNLRSVLAACCLRHLAGAKFSVAACGVPGQVAPAVEPAAREALARARIGVDPPDPTDWTRVLRRQQRAPEIVVVLDQPTAQRLPDLPGQPDVAIWPFPDLLDENTHGEPTQKDVLAMLHSLRRRLEILSNLPMRGIDRGLLRSDLRELGHW